MIERQLTLIMENKPGALARVVGLFHQRGYNIDSLHVDPIEDFSPYKFIEDAKPQIITKNSFQELSKNNRLYFIGTGQEKCKRLIKKTSNLNFSSLDNLPSSREMSQISFEKFSNSNFEDIAYFEPDYLKNFLSN